MYVTFLVFCVGLALLVGGAELLVRGASNLAARFGMSPLIIGLTIVAFGTSAPEVAVSVKASLAGQAELSFGNVIGSNIFNVLLILGVSALVLPLAVSRQLIRTDVPIMIAVSVLAFLLALDGVIGRGEGVVLLALLAGYVWLQIVLARRERNDEPIAPRGGSVPLDGAFIVGGLVLLVFGSKYLVDSSIIFARAFGVSEFVIGVTIVAAGTSLPELATSVMASIRGERDIAVGNVVGSNIFNLLGVLGAAGVVGGGIVISRTTLLFDVPIMMLVALVCLPIFFTGTRISRGEGMFFLAGYAAYLLFLISGAR